MVGMVSPWFEDPLLMGGTALGLSMGIDKFTEACGGTYKKSILGKATALGDRIENSSFVKKGFGKKVFGTIGKGISKANDLLNKSALIRAIRTTPAQAEWQTPKSELISQKVRILEDLHKIVETLHLEDDKLIESDTQFTMSCKDLSLTFGIETNLSSSLESSFVFDVDATPK